MDTFPYAEQLLKEKPNLPLAGIKVIDLTRLLPGPYATMLLGDLGADVLKVEDPQLGDYMRWEGPYINGEGASFLALNRNKRSITLNLKHPEARDIFLKLVADADILMESFRPGVLDKLGVGYAQLKKINPRLIFCAISGYGQDGPYAQRAGHDLNYIGYAGALGQTGRAGEAPALPGVQIADLGGGGILSLVGILAALEGRHRTGEGRFVDVSMTEGVASWLTYMAGNYFAKGETQKRGRGRLNGGLPEYGVYETSDGKWLTVGALEPKFFERMCDLIELPQYKNNLQSEGERADEVRTAFTTRFKQKTRDEWLTLLAGEETCVGPVYEIDEVLNDPQLQARGFVTEIEHPKAGRIKQLGCPMKMDDLPAKDVLRVPPPSFSEHTAEILGGLGFSASEIERLKKEKAI